MKTAIIEVRGIGPATAELLAAAGIDSAEELAARPLEEIVLLQGFSDIRAAQVVAAARALVTEAEGVAAAPTGSKAAKKPGKKPQKAKVAKGKKEKAKKAAKKDKKEDKGKKDKKKTDKKKKSAPKATKKTKKKK
jgi:hypothetical protein